MTTEHSYNLSYFHPEVPPPSATSNGKTAQSTSPVHTPFSALRSGFTFYLKYTHQNHPHRFALHNSLVRSTYERRQGFYLFDSLTLDHVAYQSPDSDRSTKLRCPSSAHKCRCYASIYRWISAADFCWGPQHFSQCHPLDKRCRSRRATVKRVSTNMRPKANIVLSLNSHPAGHYHCVLIDTLIISQKLC